MNTEFEAPIAALVELIKADYLGRPMMAPSESVAAMRAAWVGSIEITEGKKYIKIVTNNSVWGFIVKEAEGKFNRGDILKAASWAAPAKNFKRGNVFYPPKSVSWTGA